jgi:hypothetical protein
MRTQQVTEIATVAVGEEIPVVEKERLPMPEHEEQSKGDCCNKHERQQRQLLASFRSRAQKPNPSNGGFRHGCIARHASFPASHSAVSEHRAHAASGAVPRWYGCFPSVRNAT